MNQNYYSSPNSNPMFLNTRSTINSTGTQPPIQNIPSNINTGPVNYATSSQPPYAENLLQMNTGKLATFYMSYSDSVEWRDRVFTGIIEDAGRDYALLSDPKTGKWTILWTVYLNFVEFDEKINH